MLEKDAVGRCASSTSLSAGPGHGHVSVQALGASPGSRVVETQGQFQVWECCPQPACWPSRRGLIRLCVWCVRDVLIRPATFSFPTGKVAF